MVCSLRRRAIGLASLLYCALAGSSYAASPGIPAGTARIVIGFAPGGAADSVARIVAEGMRKEGMPGVLVDNRPGASSRLAVTFVKSAPADGLTMLMTTSAAFTIFPAAYKSLGYEPEEVRPVALLVDIPTALVAGLSQPYSDLKGYVEWARKNPDRANVGLAAQGSSGHFGTILLGQDLRMSFTPIVYRGASPMLVDVASGLVSFGYDAVASMMPLYTAKKIKFLSISGANRLKTLPDVPTAKEQGFTQFEHAMPFYGIYVPAKTPDATVAALEKVFLETMKQPEVISKLENTGFLVAPLTATEMAARIKTERSLWEPVVKSSGISLD